MSKKDVAATISGAGWIAGFITDIFTGVRNHGGTEEDIHRLTTPDGRMMLDDFCKRVANYNKPGVQETPNPDCISSVIEYDFRKIRPNYGIKLLSNNTNNPNMSFDKLRLVYVHRGGEKSLKGFEFYHRAVFAHADLGQLHAEWILRNQQHVPEIWKKYHMVFPGTVWRDKFETNYSPCLVRDSHNELYMAFMSYSEKMGVRYRAVGIAEI